MLKMRAGICSIWQQMQNVNVNLLISALFKRTKSRIYIMFCISSKQSNRPNIAKFNILRFVISKFEFMLFWIYLLWISSESLLAVLFLLYTNPRLWVLSDPPLMHIVDKIFPIINHVQEQNAFSKNDSMNNTLVICDANGYKWFQKMMATFIDC